MNQKTIVFCGLISPIIYLLATFIGGALRPGYSHIINTVSELMAPGSPNKLLMHVLFTLSAILSVIFGIGVWQFVQGSDHADLAGQFAAGLLIAIGVVTILTSSIFPQDPQMDWDAPPTFAGQMHKIMAMGVLPVLIAAFNCAHGNLDEPKRFILGFWNLLVYHNWGCRHLSTHYFCYNESTDIRTNRTHNGHHHPTMDIRTGSENLPPIKVL